MQTRWQDGDTAKSVVSPLPDCDEFAPVSDARITVTPELQANDGSVLVLLHLGSQRVVVP